MKSNAMRVNKILDASRLKLQARSGENDMRGELEDDTARGGIMETPGRTLDGRERGEIILKE